MYSIEDFGSSRFTECISIRIHRAVFQYIQKHITPNSKLYASGTSQFTDTNNGQSRLHENTLAPPQGRDFVTYFTVELRQPNAKVNRCRFQCVRNGLLPSQFFPPFLSIDLLLSELRIFASLGGAVSPAAPLGRPLLGLGDS